MQINYRFLSTLLAVFAIATTATAQTPIAHWTFDEGVNDYSISVSNDTQGGAGANAIYAGVDTADIGYTAGIVGGAVRLGGNLGADQHFEVSEIVAMDSNFSGLTFSTWFRPDPAGQIGQAYTGLLMTRTVEDNTGTGRNWGVAWEAGMNVDGRTNTQGGLDSDFNIIADGSWYHAVLVWDPDEFGFNLNPERKLYINGVEVNSQVSAGLPTGIIDSGSWSIGRDPGSESRNFRGLIDDVAIFGSVLTPTEVASLYNDGLAGIDANNTNTGVILPGDADGGGVGMSDFIAIRDNFGQAVTGRNQGDLNGDRIVDLNDYAEWAAAAPTLAAQVSLNGVPEPGTMIMISVAGLLGLVTRPKRSAA